MENGRNLILFDRPIYCRLDYGRQEIGPGKDEELEPLLIGYFDDGRLGFEAYADAIAKHYDIKLPPQLAVYCTWYHAHASNEKAFIGQAPVC